MNVLDTIKHEIQKETGLTLTPQKDLTGIPYYQTEILNTQTIIIFGICSQNPKTLPQHRHYYYDGTHFLIIKATPLACSLDATFLTQPHKFIDLNHPQSIEKIIQTIQEYANLNP